MSLLFKPRPQSILSVFHEITKVYKGNEHYLFKAIQQVDSEFSIPENRSEYTSSLEGFKSSLRFSSISGLDKLLKLIGKLVNQPYEECDCGIIENLLPKLRFDTDDSKTSIVFLGGKYFCAEWSLPVYSFGQEEQQIIHLDLFDCNQTDIVPIYIVEYVKGAILLYSQGLLKGACALMTIAMEATLRDVLAKRGYTYVERASVGDQFDFAQASIDVSNDMDKYVLSFTSTNIKSIDQYCAANKPNTHKTIRIKRRKYNNKGKYELIIRDCDELVDFFSPVAVEKIGQKTISGLGAALNIARNQEKIIEAALLPKDMDEIFTGIRNNLIHLSGAGLNSSQIKNQTVNDFVEDKDKVFDLISYVPQFINAKFRELNI